MQFLDLEGGGEKILVAHVSEEYVEKYLDLTAYDDEGSKYSVETK